VYGLLGYEPLTYEGYVYPAWANVLGWIIAGSSVAMIPAVALYQYFNTSGTHLQVILLYKISFTIVMSARTYLYGNRTLTFKLIISPEIENSDYTLA